jgi:serine/threonine protein kinase
MNKSKKNKILKKNKNPKHIIPILVYMNKSKKNKILKKNKNPKHIGGVRVFTMDGDITINPEILHEGKDFFRKMTKNIGEKKICKILMENPHKNIIKIYDVCEDYIDMELLDTDMDIQDMSKIKNIITKIKTYLRGLGIMYMDIQDMSKIKNIMMEVKTYLQSLGIMYIDWKLDNIGISEDGEIKLFDFNASGLINIETEKWIIKPPEWWSYNQSIENGKVSPIDIDNYAFDIEFDKTKYN